MVREADLYTGLVLDGRWRIDGYKNSGHFSIVLHGVDLSTGDPVAVKVLKLNSTPEAVEEMQGEIELLGALAPCDRVVDIKGHGKHIQVMTATSPSGPIAIPIAVSYVVLELAEASLADLLVMLDQVAWPERLKLFRDVVKGVHQMHLRRTVSRDLKSDNILLFVDAGGTVTTAKVADLGRARRTNQPARFSANDYVAGRGDLRFAPPECLWFQAVDDPAYWVAVDLYHLGSVLFELAVGHGVTSVVLPDAMHIYRTMQGLDEASRRAEYKARTPELRARMEIAWELFEQAVPSAIRPQASALLRQLTEPDPALRLPRTVGGRPMRSSNGLEWLLRKTDILRLGLHRAEVQAATLARRKQSRNVHA
ncbi:MAG: protein kinase [Actinomycetota bacterium]|nr:protein kinase [Actinomycetota bacterium]MDQ6945350.1 protein kinase [Actinomycetota bacterium]